MGAQRYEPGIEWDDDVPYPTCYPEERGEYVLAADHDRIVAEAEARGWNAVVEAAIEAVDTPYLSQFAWSATICAEAKSIIAAIRKPEVEG